jgi:hypothetical protein
MKWVPHLSRPVRKVGGTIVCTGGNCETKPHFSQNQREMGHPPALCWRRRAPARINFSSREKSMRAAQPCRVFATRACPERSWDGGHLNFSTQARTPGLSDSTPHCHPERSRMIRLRIIPRSRRISCSIEPAAAYRGILSRTCVVRMPICARLRFPAVQGVLRLRGMIRKRIIRLAQDDSVGLNHSSVGFPA